MRPALPKRAFPSDPTYGYAQDNSVKVGGVLEGPSRERAFLELLRGPKGELIRFERQGSCCGFKTPNAFIGGGGVLDVYHVWIGDEKEPKVLYLNMYDYVRPAAPKGFTFISLTE